MHHPFRFLSGACTAGLVLALAACAGAPSTSAGRYPAAVGASAPMSLEFGRITGIEYVPAGAAAVGQPNLIGAVVGGAVGAVLGHQIGGGSGRDAATVLGGVAGAVVGSQVGREQSITATTSPTYRVWGGFAPTKYRRPASCRWAIRYASRTT